MPAGSELIAASMTGASRASFYIGYKKDAPDISAPGLFAFPAIGLVRQ